METLKFIMLFVNAALFFVIAGFHYYWSLGGQYGFNVSIPQIEASGKKAFMPGKFLTIAVATLFLGISIGYFIILFEFWAIPFKLAHYFLWVIVGITFIRAIGDFKYIGFFKNKSNTEFAINDNRYYSPLCLFIAVTSLFLTFLIK